MHHVLAWWLLSTDSELADEMADMASPACLQETNTLITAQLSAHRPAPNPWAEPPQHTSAGFHWGVFLRHRVRGPGVATGVLRALRAVRSARDGWRLYVHMEKHRKLEQCESTLALGIRCQRYGLCPLLALMGVPPPRALPCTKLLLGSKCRRPCSKLA